MNDVAQPSAAATQAADRFEAARRDGKVLTDFPPALEPQDLAAAFQIQAELARRAGAVGAWKISYLTLQQQAAKGVDHPIAARIFGPWVHPSPARLSLPLIAPKLECEFAYALGRDLPQRAAPYTRGEVEAAIAALHPAIEVVDSRLPPNPTMPMALVDSISNAAFVFGPAVSDWRGIKYAGTSIALTINGEAKAQGSARAILGGDPIGAVVMLANHQPPQSEGLKRGQIVTTGSCTGMTPVSAGAHVVADFGPIGRVEIDFSS
jgi:2-keto-4-pentenoate hydratase